MSARRPSTLSRLRNLGHAGRPFEIVRRLGWGVADQAVTSLSNFAIGIVVARSLGADGFGAFTLAYVTYSVILNASRGLSTDPLLVRFSGPQSPGWRKAVAASTATAMSVGIIAGAACIIVGLALPGELHGAFVALGVGLPGLMVQDSWRFAFFAVGRGAKALLIDLIWAALLLGTVVVLLVSGHAGVTTYVLALGGTATVAAGVGLLQIRITPEPTAVRRWLVDHQALGGRYLVENVSLGAARQLRMFALGAFAGLAAVGYVRAAEILMGPFLVLLMGLSQVAVPEAAQVLARAPRRLGRFCFGLGAAQAVAAAAWGVAILALLPTGLGDALLGSIWTTAADLLPPVIIGLSMGGLSIGAAAGVRALGASPRSLTAQLTDSALYLTAGSVGALVDGARGSCWGVAIASTIAALVWWVQLRRALAEHLVNESGRSATTDNSEEVLS
jgi:O-antigen/teichoic acid export membrane protein